MTLRIQGAKAKPTRPARHNNGPTNTDPELVRIMLADRETIEQYRKGTRTDDDE